jgi:hypothetical protein
MILQSDLLYYLKKSGFSISVISTNSKEENMVNLAEANQLSLFQAPINNSFSTSEYMFFRNYIWEDIRKNPALYAKHLKRINNPKGYKAIFFGLLTRLYFIIHLVTNKLPFLKVVFKAYEKLMLNNDKVSRLLKEINPDLLVVTYPVNFVEASFVHEANKLKIKTVSELLSWDNITCKGRFAAITTYFLSWGPVMTEEIQEYYKVPKDKIFEIGVPHFDKHTNISPEVKEFYLTRFKKKSKKYLFFGMSSPYFAPYEIEIVEWLAKKTDEDYFGKDIELIVRPHPQNVQGNMADLNWLPRLEKLQSSKVLVDYPLLEKSKMAWSMKDEDLTKLSVLLSESLITLNSGSTLSIDSLVHGKPVIITAFDSDKNPLWENSIKRTLEYYHLEKIYSMGGITVTNSYAELEKEIHCYLHNPSYKQKERDYTLSRECGTCDGKASHRSAEALISILKES